jgi:hypothetical protein
MKSLRFMLSVVLMSLSTVAFAQSDAQKASVAVAPSGAQKPVEKPVLSEAQESFTRLKTLEGAWDGTMTTDPREPEVEGKLVQVSFRVTSRGNALMHDMRVEGLPDNPITILYRDADGLQLTHYCDAGNRPRMTGRVSPDGKSVQFDFLELAGSNQYGHMHRAAFTIIDDNHHVEDWVWMKPGDKPVRVHIDLRRKK